MNTTALSRTLRGNESIYIDINVVKLHGRVILDSRNLLRHEIDADSVGLAIAVSPSALLDLTLALLLHSGPVV